MRIKHRRFDMNLLRVMLAVWETKSISLAAMKVGMSQPATSNALARLRDATGDQLFIRTKDGMLPTAAAERVLPDLKRHFDGIFQTIAEQNIFDPTVSDRIFRLSLSGLGELMFLPRLLSKTMSHAPRIRFYNISVQAELLGHALRTNTIDAAIGLITINETGIHSHDLFQDRYVAVSGAGLKGPPATLEDLQNHRVALSAPGTSYAQDMDRLMQRFALENNVVVRLANFGALPQLLDEQPLITFLPRNFADHLSAHHDIRILPLALDEIRAPVRLVWHEKFQNDRAGLWLRQLIIDNLGVQSYRQ